VLRDEKTDSPTFRRLTEEIVTLLAYEAMREVKTEPVSVKTPVAMAQGAHLTKPKPVVVPILRAGLGMLEGMSRLIPTAEIGFLGMVRDEKTLKATTYANRLPEDLTGRQWNLSFSHRVSCRKRCKRYYCDLYFSCPGRNCGFRKSICFLNSAIKVSNRSAR
jgi:hypothetical protein